jgi:hypothetical protein
VSERITVMSIKARGNKDHIRPEGIERQQDERAG